MGEWGTYSDLAGRRASVMRSAETSPRPLWVMLTPPLHH